MLLEYAVLEWGQGDVVREREFGWWGRGAHSRNIFSRGRVDETYVAMIAVLTCQLGYSRVNASASDCDFSRGQCQFSTYAIGERI